MTVKNNKKTEVEEKPLIKRLTEFGFSSAEAAIYVYLLEKGSETGGSKIALGTGFRRQYVYVALSKLVEQGLVEHVPHGKQVKYKAKSPFELEKIGRKKALFASDLAKDLNVISTIADDQTFEVIQGDKAIAKHELDLVVNADETWGSYIIGGYSAGYTRVMGDYLDEYLSQMEKKKLRVQYIGSLDEKSLYDLYIGKFENQEYRFLEKLPKGVTHLVVRHDSVSFYSFLTPPLVYIVKSKVVAENYKQFFMMLWEMASDSVAKM